MSDDLIRRQDAIELLHNCNYDLHRLEEWILATPAIDAEPVIRCKYCKYYNERFNECDSPANIEGIWVHLEVKEDDFCSQGKRRGEQDG